jgi:hypothetical protein
VPTGQGGRPRLHPWPHMLIAQVVKRYERRHVIETERRIVDGTPARVETLRCRSQGDGVINTAYIARLNATFRERLAALARRGRVLARRIPTLKHGMYVVGTIYNFCTNHASLTLAASKVGMACVSRTPAMAAGITDHCWTVRELLAFHVPTPRWTPLVGSTSRTGTIRRHEVAMLTEFCRFSRSNPSRECAHISASL